MAAVTGTRSAIHIFASTAVRMDCAQNHGVEGEMIKTELETKRLILRPLTSDDFEAVHSWASNPINIRYMSFGPNDEESTRKFLETAKSGNDFAVVLKENNYVIGSGGIYADDTNDTGVLGWILHIDYWKRGYGTEFGAELIRYGFEDLKLRRIYADCAAVNYGSYRVMERIGMQREALHRKAFWARIDKEWVDRAVYAILATDYFKNDSCTGKTDGDLVVRLMNQDDIDLIINNFNEEDWSKPREVLEKYLDGQNNNFLYVFIAEYNGDVAGYTILYPDTGVGPFAFSKIPVISDFIVFQKYQRKGIGNKILDAAEKKASELSDKVQLGVGLHSGYGAAQRIYVKRGYMPDGSGVWYNNAQLAPYAECKNDDELVLFLYKNLDGKKI